MSCFEAQMLTGEVPEIAIYDKIGSDSQGPGVATADVSRFLQDHRGEPEIIVRINSSGGSAYEGIGIANLLLGFPGRVITVCEALAASAAALIFLAGAVRRMRSASSLMVHQASAGLSGNQDKLRKTAETLDLIDQQAAGLISRQTGIAVADVLRMMAAETWLDAPTALNLKFATEVSDRDAANVSMSVDRERLKTFKAVPEAVQTTLVPQCLADLFRMPERGDDPVMKTLIERGQKLQATRQQGA